MVIGGPSGVQGHRRRVRDERQRPGAYRFSREPVSLCSWRRIKDTRMRLAALSPRPRPRLGGARRPDLPMDLVPALGRRPSFAEGRSQPPAPVPTGDFVRRAAAVDPSRRLPTALMRGAVLGEPSADGVQARLLYYVQPPYSSLPRPRRYRRPDLSCAYSGRRTADAVVADRSAQFGLRLPLMPFPPMLGRWCSPASSPIRRNSFLALRR